MQQSNTQVIIIVSTVIIILITVGLVLLFSVFQKRKNELLTEQELAKEEFERAIAEAHIEIREETLRNISWELHDNIGQLLALAKIQIQNTTKENVKEVSETITNALIEVRSLSKLINPEAIKNINIEEAIQLEIDRFNRLDYIYSSLEILGHEKQIDKNHSIIIFRMLQEFFSNTIKHSKATVLKVILDYKKDRLNITAKDNGVGFNVYEKKEGIGLLNIKNRAKLINVSVDLFSKKNKGTTLKISYKL